MDYLKQSDFKKPPGIKVGALLPEGTAGSRSWWTTAGALTEDFSLAAGRYKPQIAEPAPEGNPAQLIRETLALEREIVTGLEKLLKEMEE